MEVSDEFRARVAKALEDYTPLVEEFLKSEGKKQFTADEVMEDVYKMLLCLFADWHRKRMMQNAVSGKVLFDYYNPEGEEVDVILADDIVARENHIKGGDDVKLIIIKQ